MEVARDFRARVVADRFVAEDHAADFGLLGKRPSAMIGKARVVVADDPHPVEPRGHRREQFARRGGQPVAAEAVVEAVAEAIEPARAALLDIALQRSQRRLRIVRRQELAKPREPARFFEVQVGDQKRVLAGQ